MSNGLFKANLKLVVLGPLGCRFDLVGSVPPKNVVQSFSLEPPVRALAFLLVLEGFQGFWK